MLAGRVGTGNVTIRHLSLSSDQGPAAASLVALLRSRAETAGDAVSHRFLRDGLEVTGELTYAGLDRRARAAAVELLTRARPGDRVLLVYPPGLEFLVGFFGSLYAGMIPVPAYPPRPPQIDERLRAIAGDARPAVAASSLDIVERLGGQVPLGDALAPLDCLALETVPDGAADQWRAPAADLSTVAHLQYTSGSTAVPKGVVVTHGNILSNLADLDGGWRHDEASTIVSWLPAFHDMGLVYGLLMPIYARIPCILMPPVIFLQRPVRWLQAITKFAGTHTAAPNFAYDHCARRVKPEDHGALDLSGWRVAVNGAEPVRPDTIDRFCATFAGAGFKRNTFAPGFGLAEATLKVTAAQSGEGPTVNTFDGRTLVGCGAPILDTVVSIVDPSTREPVADGETAEIWVGGPSVAAGYWQRPEESAETFGARTAAGAGPFLRTGDLGFVSGGQLYVAGRIKDLLIIRGQNYYPQDLELTAERSGAHVRAGCGAAFSVDRDGEERLVVVFEVERTLKPEARAGQIDLIRAAIVRDHELQRRGRRVAARGRRAQDLERQDPASRLPRRVSRRHARSVDHRPAARGRMSPQEGGRAPSPLEAVEAAAGAGGMFAGLDADARAAIEAEAQWVQLQGGDTLFREGEAGDALYVLIKGRLRVLVAGPTGDALVAEIGRGETVGEMALLTGAPRSATVVAVRDSQLVRLSQAAFERIAMRCPAAMLQITRRLVERLQRTTRAPRAKASLVTIAVVSLSPGLDATRVADTLVAALAAAGATTLVTRARADAAIGSEAVDRDSRLTEWLDALEREFRYVVYAGDAGDQAWSDRCARQADCLLFVAPGGQEPGPGVAAIVQRSIRATATRELLLLHPPPHHPPKHTARWLDATGARSHYHVREGVAADIERLARLHHRPGRRRGARRRRRARLRPHRRHPGAARRRHPDRRDRRHQHGRRARGAVRRRRRHRGDAHAQPRPLDSQESIEGQDPAGRGAPHRAAPRPDDRRDVRRHADRRSVDHVLLRLRRSDARRDARPHARPARARRPRQHVAPRHGHSGS